MTRDEVEAAIFAEFKTRAVDAESKLPTTPEGWISFASDVADRLRLHSPPVIAGKPGDPIVATGVRQTFFDLRSEQDYRYPGGKRKARIRNGEPVRRDVKNVEGIVLHQTAVEFSVSSRQLELAGGDRDRALANRGLDVACHAIAFRSGIFVATHPLDVHVNHGNGLNASSLGLEIDGRYSGLVDDPGTVAREDLRTTWKGDPTLLTDLTVRTARDALRWLVEEGRRQGMPIRKLWAHRQSSATRRSDPGEELWKAVALWGAQELGLTLEQHKTWGDGRPVPAAWDPGGVGPY